jgi:hypothetical protein
VTADDYLRDVLEREAVDTSLQSPLRTLESEVLRFIRAYAGEKLIAISPTGGFEKGTANMTGRPIDFLASFAPTVREPVQALYEGLFAVLSDRKYEPIRHDTAVAVELKGVIVDIVVGKREAMHSDVHELWVDRSQRSVKTNPSQHVIDTIASGRREEIRTLKIWRDQLDLDFPTFYLELSVLAALRKRQGGGLAENVWTVLGYLETLFPARSVLDPVNANNIVSDHLKPEGKEAVRKAAAYARAGRAWSEIIP